MQCSPGIQGKACFWFVFSKDLGLRMLGLGNTFVWDGSKKAAASELAKLCQSGALFPQMELSSSFQGLIPDREFPEHLQVSPFLSAFPVLHPSLPPQHKHLLHCLPTLSKSTKGKFLERLKKLSDQELQMRQPKKLSLELISPWTVKPDYFL